MYEPWWLNSSFPRKILLNNTTGGNKTWIADRDYKYLWACLTNGSISSGGCGCSASISGIGTMEQIYYNSTGISNTRALYLFSDVKQGDTITIYAQRDGFLNQLVYLGDAEPTDITPIYSESSSRTITLTQDINKGVIFYSNHGSSSFGDVGMGTTNQMLFTTLSLMNNNYGQTINQGIYLISDAKAGDTINCNWYTNPVLKIYKFE